MSRTLEISIDFRAGQPIYQQIVEQVERMVTTGAIQPGDQLPTVRQLAADLQVNFNTVARAYRMLDQAGVISTQHGRGTYIWDGKPVAARMAMPDGAKPAVRQPPSLGNGEPAAEQPVSSRSGDSAAEHPVNLRTGDSGSILSTDTRAVSTKAGPTKPPGASSQDGRMPPTHHGRAAGSPPGIKLEELARQFFEEARRLGCSEAEVLSILEAEFDRWQKIKET